MRPPSLLNIRDPKTPSRRARAHTMFYEGYDLYQVMAALDLKRQTASCYLHEARQRAKKDPSLIKCAVPAAEPQDELMS